MDAITSSRVPAGPTSPVVPGPATDPSAQTPGVPPRARYVPLPGAPPTRVTTPKPERSGFASGLALTSMIGGFGVNIVDGIRTGKKIPEAFRAKDLVPGLGPVGRADTALRQTVMFAPDRNIIDPQAPPTASVASAGRSFTAVDDSLMRLSSVVGVSTSAINAVSGVVNLTEAMSQPGGVANLKETKSGRTGVLQTVNGALGLGLLGVAFKGATATPLTAAARDAARAAAAGGSWANRTATRLTTSSLANSRFANALKAPIFANPLARAAMLGSGLLFTFNEFGYLDAFDGDNTRSVGQTLLDASHNTPLINSAVGRGSLLAGATAFTGWKAIDAWKGAGPRGKPIAMLAGAAALLGTHLLGGFDALNKPSEPAKPATPG